MPSYLRTSDVATRLGVSLDTVRRWLRSGELKGTPFGRAGYRIEDTDFQAFLHQRQGQAQQPATSLLSSPERYSLSSTTLEELMNAVAQELRTPLTTTRGALQQARRLLQRALESPSSDNTMDLLTKLQDLLARAERQVSAEMRLVGNLLDASRIEANKFELSLVWCNLVEIVRETVTNHLTNALKFSPADRPIKIYLQVSDAQACVFVQDKGIGIRTSEQSRIWESFQQGQRQPGGSGGGLGLGLYITRAIIRQHRGQVGVESHPGEGSTFWFTLPLAEETWH